MKQTSVQGKLLDNRENSLTRHTNPKCVFIKEQSWKMCETKIDKTEEKCQYHNSSNVKEII